jgi:uncharacterized membrane protein YkoI
MLGGLVFVITCFTRLVAGSVMTLVRPVGPCAALMPFALAVILRYARDLGIACRRLIAGLGQCDEAKKCREHAENNGLSHYQFSAVPCRPDIRPGQRRQCAPGDDARLLIHVSNMSGDFGHGGPNSLVSQSMRFSRIVTVLAVVLAVGTPAASRLANARDGDEQGREEARRAVEAGEIRSLADILNGLRGKLPGEVAGVEIEHKGSRWSYEFRVVDSQGRLFEVYVDARNGEIERIKEK